MSRTDLTNLTEARIVSLACASGMFALGERRQQGRSDLPFCEIREICVKFKIEMREE